MAAVSVLSRWSQLQRELPELSTLFSATRLPLLILAVIVVKLLHELGHGLACRRFGGECHELGLLFVGFVPLLYCDVSDSWRFADRRQRMLVSAAGILTELLLAAVAGLLWSITRPGMLHMFLLNVMLICSLNTLLVNGNPLLRYDGYYVLSDALNIPNLAGRSREALLAVFDRVVLGLASVSEGGSFRRRLLLPAWGLATTAYRIVVTIALLWLLHQTLRGVRLEFLTAGLLAVLVSGVAVTTARGMRQRVQRIAIHAEGRPRAIRGTILFAASIAALILIPLPYSVTVPMSITAGVSVPLFVPEDARLVNGLAYGQHVRTGAVVAELESGPLDWDVEHVRSELALAETRRDALLALRGADPTAANRLPAAEQDVQSAMARLEAVERRRESLTVVSPCDGLLLPPRNQPAVRNLSIGQPLESVTARWSGRPLDRENRGAWLPATTPIGFVGRPQDLRAECLLRQQDVEWVAEGAEVQLTMASQPGHQVSGHVSRIQTVPENSVARELIVSRLVATDPHNPDAPADTLFAVHVAPADIPPDSGHAGTNRLDHWPPLYSTGHATIHCRPQSLSRRLWRFVCHTFTFER
jgi:putative peptide zinc metalloprotease protein